MVRSFRTFAKWWAIAYSSVSLSLLLVNRIFELNQYGNLDGGPGWMAIFIGYGAFVSAFVLLTVYFLIDMMS